MNPVQPPLKKPNETRRPPSRPHKRGDTLAEGQYALAATSYAIGTVAATISVFYPLLLGALGAAIVFALSGYYFVKLAEGNESSPLEKWARLDDAFSEKPTKPKPFTGKHLNSQTQRSLNSMQQHSVCKQRLSSPQKI